MKDSHVHIGQYKQIYFYPDRVVNALAKNGVDECIVSSTTSCIFCRELHPEYSKNASAREIENAVTNEIECAVKTGDEVGVMVKPLYWLVPEFEKCFVRFEDYFSNDIGFKYAGFKIHTSAQNWNLADAEIYSIAERVFSFANEKSLLILIHTGIDEFDSPLKFEEFIKYSPNAQIQLAHCKNIGAINYMLDKYKNVFTDNSTTPNILSNGKILFGSDFPVLSAFNSDPKTSELAELYKNMCCNFSNEYWSC